MKHVRDIRAPRPGKFVRMIDAVTLEPFEGEVSERTGKSGGPIIVAPHGTEREFVFARGDRIDRIAARPWGRHTSTPTTVDHEQAARAISRAERRARFTSIVAAALAAVSVALVGAIIISAGVIP